ncbi:MAG: SDR family oxidoreductase [Flavobacteriales bacterium]|nr:SDR family oxidoreductase [Flavobacteriales bacterium]
MSTPPYLIVGASRGIGRSIAERLVSQGRPVITVARSPATVDGVMDHWTCDVVQDGLPAGLLPDSLAGMVYCPGTIDLKPLRSMRAEDMDLAWRVNVLGAFRCAQATADRLRKVPGSAMLFFSTVAVRQGMAFHASVASAKGGVEGLVRSLAAELVPSVRVNAIAPSLTATPLAEKLLSTPEKAQALAERNPMKRLGTTDDMAAMAVMLLGPDAGWITGQVIAVDGGMSVLR